MLQSLFIGATGMLAQQQNVDSIANNLANVNTTGFKRNRVSFTDAYYRMAQAASLQLDGGSDASAIGLGTLVSGNPKLFVAGELKQTSIPLDIAIRGSGFLEVTLPDGSAAYTRHGALRINKDGLLGTIDGYPLKQQLAIPPEATETVIDAVGKVSVRMPNETALVEIGQLELAGIANPETLEPVGENLYVANQRTAAPVVAKPGEEGLGAIAQGYLEASNVQLADEMVNLVLAQRAYELNAKVIQASDEMLSITNNLRR